jgi:hypothetical protein
MKLPFAQFGFSRLQLYILIGAFIIVILVLLLWSNASSLGALQAISGTPTPTAWYADLPPEKRTIAIRIEQERQTALKETPSGLITKVIPPPPTPLPIDVQLGGIARRAAGAGTIVESGQAPFPSYYLFLNKWYEIANGKVIQVFAGAQRSDPLQGGKYLDKPWPGLVIVSVSAPDFKTFFPKEGGEYRTPLRVGPVNVTDAVGERLVLVSDSGTTFYFDVPTRQFVPSLIGAAPTLTSTSMPTPTRSQLYP